MKTTINIRANYQQLILNELTGRDESMSSFICSLLESLVNRKFTSLVTDSCVQYQESDANINYVCQHVSIPVELYEKCIDMRNLYKLSVSLIVLGFILIII